MNVAELAARNRAAKLEMLAKLRPKVAEARQAVEIIREAQKEQGQARKAVEQMQRLRHVPNFFPTPPALVQRMIEAANIGQGARVLEPSAGKGDILKAIRPAAEVLAVELNYSLIQHLEEIFFSDGGTFPRFAAGSRLVRGDFLECTAEQLGRFDRVLMNPPFERGADSKHIRHAYEFLKPGGRLVAIGSSVTGQQLGEWKRSPDQRTWVEQRNGWVEMLPAKSFATSERPTNVNTCLLVVEKGNE